MIKYRIAWKHKQFDFVEGCGKAIFTDKKSAEAEAEKANRDFPFINHWVESVNIKEVTK